MDRNTFLIYYIMLSYLYYVQCYIITLEKPYSDRMEVRI